MKQYIKIDGTCFKADGWTDTQVDDFLDALCILADKYDAQLTCSVTPKTEKELLVEDE